MMQQMLALTAFLVLPRQLTKSSSRRCCKHLDAIHLLRRLSACVVICPAPVCQLDTDLHSKGTEKEEKQRRVETREEARERLCEKQRARAFAHKQFTPDAGHATRTESGHTKAPITFCLSGWLLKLI